MTTARDLSAHLRQLLRAEQGAMADFLLALAAFDQREAWRELGYTSLFTYLHRELGLSKGAAYYRKTAADLLRANPEVIEPLRDGRLCLTTVGELARVLTPENKDRVLPSFFHLSRREAQEAAAALAPIAAPPQREVITALRPAPPVAALDLAAPPPPATDGRGSPVERPPLPAGRPPSPPPSTSEPLTEALSRLHLTVSKDFLRKLEAARDALSHSRPGASADEILEAGLDLLLRQADRRKGLVERPRKTPPPSAPDSDQVPAHVRREVWERDQGRCQWPMADGTICGSTHRLELDHVACRARGGPSTVANLRVLCKAHNDESARQVFGDAWMDQFTRKHRPRPIRSPRRGAMTGGDAGATVLGAGDLPAEEGSTCRAHSCTSSWPPTTSPGPRPSTPSSSAGR